MKRLVSFWQSTVNGLGYIDFLGPLAIRLYLIPIFLVIGWAKVSNLDGVIGQFTKLNIPFPTISAYLASYAEFLGALSLIFGFALRFTVIPLMIVMLVAAFWVHGANGWYVVAPSHTEGSMRLQGFMNWLSNAYPGRHNYITEHGRPVLSNNGMQYAITYFIMLLSLLFTGAGKYVSMDYWISRYYKK